MARPLAQEAEHIRRRSYSRDGRDTREMRDSTLTVQKTQNPELRTSDPASLACLAQRLKLPAMSLLCLTICPRERPSSRHPNNCS